MAKGHYDKALNYSIKKYNSKPNTKYISKLETLIIDAFNGGNVQNLSKIEQIKTHINSTEKSRLLYQNYNEIKLRHEKITSLLPFPNNVNKKFNLVDYNKPYLLYKKEYASKIEKDGDVFMSNKTKLDYRKAYALFKEASELFPSRELIKNKVAKAKHLGTAFVFAQQKNNSDTYLSSYTRGALSYQSFNDYNSQWTVFHEQFNENIDYDFDVIYDFQEIEISKEKEWLTQLIREKTIEHKSYLKDDDGHFLTDSLGRKQYEMREEIIRCNIDELRRHKSIKVLVKVTIFNNRTEHRFAEYFEDEIIFEDWKAEFSGNRNAVEQAYLDSCKDTISPFPSDYALLKDCVLELKNKSKSFILRKVRQ